MTPCHTAPYSASVSARWTNLKSNLCMESTHEAGYLDGSSDAIHLYSLSTIVYLCPASHSPRSAQRERLSAVEHRVLCLRLCPDGVYRTAHDAPRPEPVSSSNAKFKPSRPMVYWTRSQICNGGISGIVWICSKHGWQFFHPGSCIVCEFSALAAALATGNRSNTN